MKRNSIKIHFLPILWIMICGIWAYKEIIIFGGYFVLVGIVGMFIDNLENDYFHKEDRFTKEWFKNMSAEQIKALTLSWLAFPFWLGCYMDKEKRLPKWIRIE